MPSQKPATQKPVTAPPPGSEARQEEMFDSAHQMSLRGEQAAQALSGNKKAKKKKDVKKKNKSALDDLLGDNKRVDGVFPDGDPHNKQEEAFQQAAEFEEKVLDSDLTFSRKAGQVQVGDDVFRIDLDGEKGALVAGESSAEITGSFDIDVDDDAEATQTRGVAPPPRPSVSTPASPPTAQQTQAPPTVGPSLRNVPEDTIPNVEIPTSETGLRKMLGLKTKAK